MAGTEDSVFKEMRRFLGVLVPLVGLLSGFLSWYASNVLMGARVSTLEIGFAAHVAESKTAKETLQAEVQALKDKAADRDRLVDLRLQHIDDNTDSMSRFVLGGGATPSRARSR